MNNLLDYTLDELKVWMSENGESAFRGKQILSWIYKGVMDFKGMKNIPKSLINKLEENFTINMPEIVEVYKSELDGTEKFLLGFPDGNLIESVLMRYKHGNSICISTQVGCRIVSADYGLNIGQRHITLSTCGIVPKIYELADKELSITLAISLHAFSDEKRKEIMPIANKYTISELLEACRYYLNKTKRRITFEYALVKDVNDGMEDAKALGKLLSGMLCHVNFC